MTTLVQYERARAALAEATRVDEVLSIRDEMEHIKLYARQIRDRTLLAEAAVFQRRVERKLGFVLSEAKKAGQIKVGRPKKVTGDEPFIGLTLDEIGVDKHLSARAQQQASLPDDIFEQSVEATRQGIAAGSAKIIEAVPINGARAVMGSRLESADSLDFYPTPPTATRALMSIVLPQMMGRGWTQKDSIWEPACGEGHMAEVLKEYTTNILATDCLDYGYADTRIHDFLGTSPLPLVTDWIITNPPFRDKTEEFVLRALDLAQVGVAMFVRLQWLETIGRYERLFRDQPPTRICFFAERMPLHRGRFEPKGATATAYIWLVWMAGKKPMPPFWIPPGQRERLTKPDDAARFTAHPVIRKEDYDPSTGEVKPSVTAPPPPRESPIVTQNEEPQCLS
jgi:hypothetical protein